MTNLPYDPNTNQAPKPPSSNDVYLYVRDQLPAVFTIYGNRHGTIFFVDITTMRVQKPEDSDTINRIKHHISHFYRIKANTNTILEAINFWKGSPWTHLFQHHLYIRVIDNTNVVYLQESNDYFWCISKDAIRCDPLPANPVPANIQASTSPNPELRLPPPIPHHWDSRKPDIKHQSGHPQPNIRRLFDITPLPKDKDLLVISWLILTLLPRYEQVALQITGDAGEGKTYTQDLLTSLIDPQEHPIISPTKKNEIAPHLPATHIVSMDNVEELNTHAQELLRSCLINHVYRPNTNKTDPYAVDIRRSVILNCLEPVITAKELQKRTITIDLVHTREHPVESPHADDHLKIFSGLLKLLSQVLARVDDPWEMRHAPHELRDYCHIGQIVSKILDDKPKKFERQLRKNLREKTQRIIGEHEVAAAIQEWIRLNPEGDTLAVSKWHKTLKAYKPDTLKWPETTRGMSSQLREASSLLGTEGIEVKNEGKRGSHGYWTIRAKSQ